VKRLLAITLAITYLLVSSGILLEIHHCMGRIANTGFSIMAPSGTDECGKCGMTKSNTGKHCCNDEYKQVKISIDQKPSSLDFSIGAPAVAMITVGWLTGSNTPVPASQTISCRPHGPPPLLPNRQSLLCNFRI